MTIFLRKNAYALETSRLAFGEDPDSIVDPTPYLTMVKNPEKKFFNYYLNLLNGLLLVNVTRLQIYLLFMMRNCFLVCVSGLITACIICCQVNVTLDTILGIEDILISWFLIILVLLDVALLFVCCLIHCKHLRLSDVNKYTYLLTYLGFFTIVR